MLTSGIEDEEGVVNGVNGIDGDEHMDEGEPDKPAQPVSPKKPATTRKIRVTYEEYKTISNLLILHLRQVEETSAGEPTVREIVHRYRWE